MRRTLDRVTVVLLQALVDLYDRGFFYADLRPANLRVIDASVIPTTVSGNTAGATMMIGHKGAAMVAGVVWLAPPQRQAAQISVMLPTATHQKLAHWGRSHAGADGRACCVFW